MVTKPEATASGEVEPRQRLIDAADVLMYARGYEAVGVADLCREADVRKGSFYHFFESKQQLALAMLDHAWTRTRRVLLDPSIGSEELGVIEAMTRYGELLADNLERNRPNGEGVAGCRFGNFAVELSVRDEEVRAKVADVLGRISASMGELIERGVASGELRADLVPEQAAADLVAYMEGLMVMAKAQQEPGLLRRLGPVSRQLLT